jgi:hypothetical protein
MRFIWCSYFLFAGVVRFLYHVADVPCWPQCRRRVGIFDRPALDEHAVAAPDERVYGSSLHQHDADQVGLQAGRAKQEPSAACSEQ